MYTWLNILKPSDYICSHRSKQIMDQVMACCLSAPCHYLNLTQCWLIMCYHLPPTPTAHNPLTNPTMHLSQIPPYTTLEQKCTHTFLFQWSVLLDMRQVYHGMIWEISLLGLLYSWYDAPHPIIITLHDDLKTSWKLPTITCLMATKELSGQLNLGSLETYQATLGPKKLHWGDIT